jgi:hypothetical protein
MALLVAVLVVTMGLVDLLRAGDVRRLAERGQLNATETPGPCDHLTGWGLATTGLVGSTITVTDLVSMSQMIAEVAVAEVLPAGFDTTSGSPPPPPTPTSASASPTATPTGAWYDNVEWQDDRLDTLETERIFRPVVVSVTVGYTGTEGIVGFVVPRWGGEDEPCAGYRNLEPQDPMVDGFTTGTSGMLFLSQMPREWESDPPGPWYSRLVDVAAAVSEQEEATYVAATPESWWWFDQSGLAHAVDFRPLSVEDLEGMVQDGLN